MHAISYFVLINVLDDLYIEWFKLSIACESIKSVTIITLDSKRQDFESGFPPVWLVTGGGAVAYLTFGSHNFCIIFFIIY
jgi:hypothetical protein